MTTRSSSYAGLVAALAILVAGGSAAAADDPALLAAERAFALALRGGSATPAANLMDAGLTWTDAAGRTLGKAEIAQALPPAAIAGETDAEVRRFEYGRVAVVRVDRGRLHTLRVWIRRPGGWRLLVYQEVRSLEQPPTTTPGTGAECINPCRQVPYTPTHDDERAVIAAYQALETAAHAADVSRWGTHVADEFVLVSSNSDRTFTRAARLDGLRRASKGGVAPTRLLTADMVREPDVVVMRAEHEPDQGARLRITRVWVRRDGVWQSTLSYQTAIRQGASRAPASRPGRP
jgi:hypothetical protein